MRHLFVQGPEYNNLKIVADIEHLIISAGQVHQGYRGRLALRYALEQREEREGERERQCHSARAGNVQRHSLFLLVSELEQGRYGGSRTQLPPRAQGPSGSSPAEGYSDSCRCWG